MIYLNYAAMSPTFPEAEQEMKTTLTEFKEYMYSDAGIQWYRNKVQRCRETVTDFLQVSNSASIAFVPNASTANYFLLSSIDWNPGDRIVSSTHENPSIRKELLALQPKGVETRFLLPTSSPQQFLESLEQTLDEPNIRAIILSHVSHVDGRIFPIQAIAALANARNILLVVDGAQAVGHIDVNLETLDCDAYFFSGYKWCCGPLGTGGLVTAKRLLNRVPATQPEPHSGKQQAPSRFEIGTQNIGLIAGLAKACEMKKREGFHTEALKKIREDARCQLTKSPHLQTREWHGPHAPGILTFQSPHHDRLMKLYRKEQIVTKEFTEYPEGETPAIRMSWQGNIDAGHLNKALEIINT